jgi:hypothetical protein
MLRSCHEIRKKRNVYEIDTAADGRFEYYEENIVVNGLCGPSLRVTITKAGYTSKTEEFCDLCHLKRYDHVLRRE